MRRKSSEFALVQLLETVSNDVRLSTGSNSRLSVDELIHGELKVDGFTAKELEDIQDFLMVLITVA